MDNFIKNVETMFQEELSEIRIMVKDIQRGEVLKTIPYEGVFFDSFMNLYKIVNGVITKVSNDNFKVTIIKNGDEI